MKKDKNLITLHYPELIGNEFIPLNYQLSRHFTLLHVDDEGKVIREEKQYEIEIEKLQCFLSEFQTFYKPISRVLDEYQ